MCTHTSIYVHTQVYVYTHIPTKVCHLMMMLPQTPGLSNKTPPSMGNLPLLLVKGGCRLLPKTI